jgi:uncharacterized sporulation protein YeaH/YhbH (DUF444 family)
MNDVIRHLRIQAEQSDALARTRRKQWDDFAKEIAATEKKRADALAEAEAAEQRAASFRAAADALEPPQ